jgi:hypothetical protein
MNWTMKPTKTVLVHGSLAPTYATPVARNPFVNPVRRTLGGACLSGAALVVIILSLWVCAICHAGISNRADWQQRVEADWLLAEEVAAQDQLGGLLTTKADAADDGKNAFRRTWRQFRVAWQ